MEKNSHMLTVGDFVLNTDSRKLFFKDNTEVALPPTLFTLLKYFVDNQNQVLSKDMIISNVWKGKIVVEANINQNIKKLRDVLGDSASNPKYIETVTGEGFRFVANSEDYKSVPSDNVSKQSKLIYVVGGGVALIFFGLVYLMLAKDAELTIRQPHPLTTLKGIESNPELSSDKKYLLFNNKNEGSWDIFVKPLNKESYYPIIQSEHDEYFPKLSKQQDRIIYYVISNTECGLFMRDINLEDMSVGEPIEIKDCLKPDERIFAEWINENEVFISVNEDLNSAANIFHLNLVSKEQTLISKPDSKGFGDYVLKYSKKQNKLAYVRNIGWSSSEIWVFDLETKKHQLVKSIQLSLTGIDWTDNGMLLFQSANKEISKMQYDGSGEKKIVRLSSNISHPFSIDKDTYGAVFGDFYVTDIDQFDIETRQKNNYVSSSFNDFYGVKANDYFVFVSNRSGEQQIWRRDLEGNDIQLTHFNRSYEIKRLSVTSDGSFIMFNKNNGIEIIDRNGKEIFNSKNYSNNVHNNPIFDDENDRIIYSVQYEEEWNIESRSLSSLAERIVLLKGTSARPCLNEDCLYYFKDKDPYMYKYLPQSNSSIQLKEVGFRVFVDEWDVYKKDQILVFDTEEQVKEIKILNLVSGDKTVLYKTNSRTFSFDRAKQKIYTHIVSQGNTDLMYFNLK